MDFDSYKDVKAVRGADTGFVAFASSGSFAASSVAMDASGMHDILLCVWLEIPTPTAYALKLQSSDDAATWFDTPEGDFCGRDPALVGDGVITGIISAAAAYTLTLGINGRSRYYRIWTAGGTAGSVAGFVGLIGASRHIVPDEVL